MPRTSKKTPKIKRKNHQSVFSLGLQWAAVLILLAGFFGVTAYPVKRMALLWLGKTCDYQRLKIDYSVDGIKTEWGYSGYGFPMANNFLKENKSEQPMVDKNIYGK